MGLPGHRGTQSHPQRTGLRPRLRRCSRISASGSASRSAAGPGAQPRFFQGLCWGRWQALALQNATRAEGRGPGCSVGQHPDDTPWGVLCITTGWGRDKVVQWQRGRPSKVL